MTELLPEPRVEAISYEVSILPADDFEGHVWSITVERRGPDAWAVCRMRETLNAAGKWEWEPSGSNRDDDYLARSRFPLEEALELAKAEAPRIVVNGLRAVDVPAWRAARRAEQEARDAGHRAAARLQQNAREEAERRG